MKNFKNRIEKKIISKKIMIKSIPKSTGSVKTSSLAASLGATSNLDKTFTAGKASRSIDESVASNAAVKRCASAACRASVK